MPASQRHLDQLLIILNGNSDLTSADAELHRFFDSMVIDRLRVNKSDWLGQRVHTMLWHFPDLKPALKIVVSDYVTERWRVYRDAGTTDGVETIGHEGEIARPLPQAHPIGEHVLQALDNTDATPDDIVPAFVRPDPSSIRKDWFDRLTDWVASTVTLWK